MISRLSWIATAAFLAVAQPASASTLNVVGTGDGIDALRALATAFSEQQPDIRVMVPPSIGSGGAIAAVGADREMIGRIARPLSDTERGQGLVATPFMRIPSAIFVHPSAGVNGLSSKDLARIYSGEVTNWREVGGADLKIRVVRREDADSTLTVLRVSMPYWRDLKLTSHSKTALTTQEAVDTVATVEGAIGFGPFSRPLETRCAVLSVDGRYPTQPDYPSAVTVAFLHKPATASPDVQSLLDFSHSEKAKALISGFGAVPTE